MGERMINQEDQEQLDKGQKQTSQPKKKNSKLDAVYKVLREIVAIWCWGYVTIKLFFFDIDVYFVEKFFPSYMWVITYRFFIIIGLASLIWVTLKNKQIILSLLFIVFYPLIIVFWRIPFFIIKNKRWNLLFAFVDSVVSFFASFKKTFITTSVFLIATVMILASSNKVLLWLSIIVLTLILLLIFFQRMISVFRQSMTYKLYGKFFSFGGNNLRNSSISTVSVLANEGYVGVENLEDNQIQSIVTDLQTLVLMNRVCLVVAKGLKSYQETGWRIISSVLGILLMIIYTVFSFATINYGLYKINPNYFTYLHPPTFFNFFYYSFNLLLNSTIPEIVATTSVAQIFSMVQAFFALFLVLIFVTLVFTFRSQREMVEINVAIDNLSEEGKVMENFIRDHYKLETIEVAIKFLETLKAVFVKWLYQMTESIK